MRDRILLPGALLLLVVCGCERLDPATLPAVPELPLDGFVSAVRAQLEQGRQAVERRPRSARAAGHYAMMLHAYLQFEAAEAMYLRARMLDEGKLEWAYLHALVLDALGQPGPALEAINVGLRAERYGPARIMRAELLSKTGRVDEARKSYLDLMSGSPPPEAWFSYGRFLLAIGEAAAAVAPLQRALETGGHFGAGHYQLSLALRQAGDGAAAQRHLQLSQVYEGQAATGNDPILARVLALNRNSQVLVARARSLARRGEIRGAIDTVELALAHNADDVEARAVAVGLYAQQGQFDKAQRHFDQGNAVDPDNPRLHYNLGLARAIEQRFVEAGQAFARAASLDPHDGNTQVQLGLLAHHAQRSDAAMRFFDAALAIDPAHADAHWLKAVLLITADNNGAAIAHLQAAAAKPSPRQPTILAALAESSAAIGDWDGARAAMERAFAAAELLEDTQQREHVRRRAAVLERQRVGQ